MTQKIVLVRHGRSGHIHTGFIDHAGFRRWREAYEAAGIDERDEPPSELKALAVASGIILASTAPRAMESAKRLHAGRDITTSPLLHELELAAPEIRGIRMPLAAWAVAVGLQWGIRAALRRPYVSPAELRRSREAADWLSGLAAAHGTVLAVTHASFRSLVSKQLIGQGWHCEIPKRRSSHWSAWSFRRAD